MINHLLVRLQIPAGLVGIGFVMVQFVTGPRWIKWKLRVRVHRITGFITVGVATFHALIGIYLNYFMR